MSEYLVRPGDTFETIARIVYGDDQLSGMIARANPGVNEPLQPDFFVIVPDIQQPATIIPATDDPDQITITIDGQVYRFWTEVTFTKSIDSFDSVNFRAPFDPDREDVRETFRPFSFKPVTIYIGNILAFTGTLVNVNPELQPISRVVAAGCYARCAVINDCTAPASGFPLEYRDTQLDVITDQITGMFGFSSEFPNGPGTKFPIVRCSPTQTLFSFLTQLAQKRNLVISNTNSGDLLFRRASGSSQPVALFREGRSPVISVGVQFSPQSYYSHITGLTPIALARVGSQFTVVNSRLCGVLRPLNFDAGDTTETDITTTTNDKVGRMFGNMVSYSVQVSTWRTPAGDLWEPDMTVQLTSPGAMVYQPTNLIIRRVSFNQAVNNRTATLDLVLLGSFSGGVPESLPWE